MCQFGGFIKYDLVLPDQLQHSLIGHVFRGFIKYEELYVKLQKKWMGLFGPVLVVTMGKGYYLLVFSSEEAKEWALS